LDEELLKARQNIDLAFGAAGFFLSATFLFTALKSGALTSKDAIQIVRDARAMPKDHPLPSFAADALRDALKMADHLLKMIEETVSSVPSAKSKQGGI